MISKELLEVILNRTIHSRKRVAQTSIIRYVFDANGDKIDSSINVYELAFECKMWASTCGEFGYIIDSNTNEAIVNASCDDMPDFKMVIENDETECIFQAAQWILNKELQ